MKVNIVIDMNLLFNRYAFYLSNNKGYYLDKPFQHQELVKFVHRNIEIYTNNFDKDSIESIHLVFDEGKSWRTELFPKITDYKEGRDKESFDHISFKKIIQEYSKIMDGNSMYVYQIAGLEADDIIGYIIKHYRLKNKSSIIISSDSDLKQLVYSTKESFCCMYDADYNKQLHYIDNKNNYEISEDTVQEFGIDDFTDFFDENSQITKSETKTFDIRKTILSKYEEIDCLQGLLVKIFSGDKTDRIPSVFIKKTDGGNDISFGKSNAKNLYDGLVESNTVPSIFQLYTIEEIRRGIASKILSLARSKDLTKIDDIQQNIVRNIHLIYLDSDYQKDFNLAEKYDIVENKLRDNDFFQKHTKTLSELKFSKEHLRNTSYYYDDAKYFRNV